jgi:hypothetical protein
MVPCGVWLARRVGVRGLTVMTSAGLVHAALVVAVDDGTPVETATRLGVGMGRGEGMGRNPVCHKAIPVRIAASRTIRVMIFEFLFFPCARRAGTVELPRKFDGNARSISAR